MPRLRLGEALIESGLITEEQLQAALQHQKEQGGWLGDVVVTLGFAGPEEIADVLAEHLHVPRAHLDTVLVGPELLDLLPEEVREKRAAFPVKREGNVLHVAMADPYDVVTIDDIKAACDLEVKAAVASQEEIDAAYRRHEDLQASADQVIAELDEDEEEGEGRQEESSPELGDVPGVRVANLILYQGVREGASDIHIQPQENEVRVRFRIDGVLQDVMQLPKRLQRDLTSRLKVMADLDITNRHRPQDGRFRVSVEDRSVDMRISTLPSVNGEKVVLRVLNRAENIVPLEDIGFWPDSLEKIGRIIAQPQGLILVTGPTGSGKTTTLYAFLQRLNQPGKNVITVEDPVEYRVEGLTQVQVREHGGVTFAEGLRSVVRQDPDIIMVGEIRDADTAAIAVRAALTGHLVLSTVHTTSAAGALTRLLDLGIEPFLLSSTVIGVIAQRLVRRLCPNCRVRVTDLQDVERKFLGEEIEQATIYRASGCSRCSDTGYRGRLPIEEVLLIGRELRDLIRQGIAEDEIVDLARRSGMVSLRENGVRRVLNGDTTLEEVIKAVFSIDDVLEADEEFLEGMH